VHHGPTALQPSFEITVAASPAGRSPLSDDLSLVTGCPVGRRIDEIEHDRSVANNGARSVAGDRVGLRASRPAQSAFPVNALTRSVI
jgi:hypothetical protein